MKVCIVSDGLPYQHGGAQLRAYRHSLMLIEAGIPTRLVAWNRGESPEDTGSLPKFVHPVKLSVDPHISTARSLQVLRTTAHLLEVNLRLGRLLSSLRADFDIIHVINAASFFCLSVVPWGKFLKKPVIIETVSLGGDDPITLGKRSHQREFQFFPHRPLKLSLFLGADAYVCKSNALLQACQMAGIPKDALYLIHSGVDTDFFSPPTESLKLHLRKKLFLPPERIITLFVGGMDAKKGVTELFSAFDLIIRKHPQAHLVILGDCNSFSKIYKSIIGFAQEHNLTDNVTILGHSARNIQEYMQASDIFLHPSWREGFSMAILEAMSTGLPVIATDIPAISENQITDSGEGLLVPVGDVDAIVASLNQLIDAPETRKALGIAARKKVLAEFTFGQMAENYIKLYKYLFESSSA